MEQKPTERATDEELAEFLSLCDVDGEREALKQAGYGFARRIAAEVTALRAEGAERVKSLAAVSASLIMARAEIERLTRENAVLADDAARAPRFVPFAGGEVS